MVNSYSDELFIFSIELQFHFSLKESLSKIFRSCVNSENLYPRKNLPKGPYIGTMFDHLALASMNFGGQPEDQPK